jgi:hypothetical protein
MRTPPRGCLPALLGSVLGAVLFSWLGSQLVLATHQPDPAVPSTVGPVFAGFFAVLGGAWLGSGLGCGRALRLRRAQAIGGTIALLLLLSPLAFVFQVIIDPLLNRIAPPTASNRWVSVASVLALLGVISVFAHWVALQFQQPAKRQRAVNT